MKAIAKVACKPMPHSEGLGKPFGNHNSSKLSGYYKIKLRDLGYRIVYDLVCDGNIMRIIIISVQDDDEIYREAERRINKR